MACKKRCCVALTKTGARCQRSATKGKKKCYAHDGAKVAKAPKVYPTATKTTRVKKHKKARVAKTSQKEAITTRYFCRAVVDGKDSVDGHCKNLATTKYGFCKKHVNTNKAFKRYFNYDGEPVEKPSTYDADAHLSTRTYCRAGINSQADHCMNIADTEGGFCKKHQKESNRPFGSWRSGEYVDD